MTVHPECIGRGHRMAMLERFLDAASALDGVAFERLDTVVDRWAAGSVSPVRAGSSHPR